MGGRWLAVLVLTGCADLADSLGAFQLPDVAVERVDLAVAPTADAFVGRACVDYLSPEGCVDLGFAEPTDEELRFGFDLVLEVANLDDDETATLTDLFVTLSLVDPWVVDAACFSLCDPDDPSCVPAVDADGACTADTPEEKLTPGDVEVTAEDLLALADAPEGNGQWRSLRPGRTGEVSVRIDLASEAVLEAAAVPAIGALNRQLETGTVSPVALSFTLEGTATFQGANRVEIPRTRGEWRLEPATTTPTE
jgi:hypothetical protein